MSERLRIRELSGEETAARSAELATILIDCVAGGASVSFMAPLARDKAEAFWRQVADSVRRGERALFVAEESDGALAGTAQLVLDLPENQRRGVGAALMRAVEEAARHAGRTLLALDTTSGRDADRLYERLGWTRFGIMPGHALMPDGTLSDTAYFYKRIG
jgi:GNAT superfamily N-acetyltransferase